jgi:acyl-homoserine lactone synthase
MLALHHGELLGGSRLISADHPTLLSEIYPSLVERGEVPRDRQTLEWTRFFVVPRWREGARGRTVAGALICAVMEYCLATGMRQVGGVIETFWLPHAEAFGWRTTILGLPQLISGSMTIAAFFTVDEAALAGVRRVTGWRRPLLPLRAEPLRRAS